MALKFDALRTNHGEAVYIIRNMLRYIINAEHCISSIPQELHIINSAGIAYHQDEVLYIIIGKAKYSLRLVIYTFGDEMHAYA